MRTLSTRFEEYLRPRGQRGGGQPQARRITGVPSKRPGQMRPIRLQVAAIRLEAEDWPLWWPRRCLPGRASALRPPACRRCNPQRSGSSAGPGGGLHNARHCPSLASCRWSRRPHPQLAGDLFPAPDWLLAPTEVRAVSHTRAHVDLGAGTGLKGPRHHNPANGRRTPCTVNNGREGRGGKLPLFGENTWATVGI